MQQSTQAPRGWEFAGGPTDDAPASHLTANEVIKMALDAGQSAHQIAAKTVLVRCGSFVRDFTANGDGLFRAAPIRSWLGIK